MQFTSEQNKMVSRFASGKQFAQNKVAIWAWLFTFVVYTKTISNRSEGKYASFFTDPEVDNC